MKSEEAIERGKCKLEERNVSGVKPGGDHTLIDSLNK